MARIFLDTNYFIDLVEQRKFLNLDQFQGYKLFISPLSVHILTYLYKYKIPHKNLLNLMKYFTLLPMDQKILNKSLQGPTQDFEDNIQLHSAAQGNCNIFLTRDNKLLKLKFFGKAKLTDNLPS